jgi:LysM repeat protein
MSTATLGFGFAPAQNRSAVSRTTSSSEPRLRMTRRGRIVLTVLISVPLVVAALLLAVNGGGAVATSSAGASLHYVTVQGGETLWQLAGDIAPQADPRDVVSDIVHLNQLSSTTLQTGQRIAIPQQYEK